MSLAFHERREQVALAHAEPRLPAIVGHLAIGGVKAPAEQPAGGLACLSAGRAELRWIRSLPGQGPLSPATINAASGAFRIFARLTDDRRAEALLGACGGDWTRAVSITAPDGTQLASIWRERGGDVFLPFDPDEVCLNCWSERYLEGIRGAARRRGHSTAVQSYYRVRGLLPRQVQIMLRRAYAIHQARAEFPRWPAEDSLHAFLGLYSSILCGIAGEPLAQIAAWPGEHSWALVLTHDVETATGMAAVDPVVELERGLGLRSSWNVVPRRYAPDEARIRRLIDEGFEVGVHGLLHDGRDLESAERVTERLPGMRAAAERWDAVGFRAPATQRGWELMPMLGFDYDTSYPDSDPFEPQAGGCCSWLPFFNQGMVELPLTMPQDHTIFVILRRGAEPWHTKAEYLRARGGMALIVTHPDYLIEPEVMAGYRGLLERYARDTSAWHALPREVSAWWRRRAASSLERSGGGWAVTGPAADEARVELIEETPWS